MSQDRPYRVAMVCLGNICRSPMAHVVLDARLAEAGLTDRVEVVSAGTGSWHTGDPMDPRAAATLREAGYDPDAHRARHFTTDWFVENDLLLAMDHSNRADMLDQSPTVAAQEQVRLFRSFDPQATEGDDEVPDPYFGQDDGFATVLTMIERTTDVLVDHLRSLV